MKRYISVMLLIAVLTMTSATYAFESDNSQINGLNVTDDIDAAFNASQSENKTLMIVFDQDSCVYCDLFKSDVLSNPQVQKELNENYVVLLVDINKNPNIAAKYKVYGTPSTQFIDSSGRQIYKIEGYVGSGEFLKVLKEI